MSTKRDNPALNTTPIDEELKEIFHKRLCDVPDEMLGKEELSRRDIRSLAFHLLYALEQFDYSVSLESIVDNFRRGFEMDIADDSPAIAMARGASEKREELDKLILPLLKNWKIERLGCCTRLILRLALFELTQPDPIPSIIINEAIELAKGFAEKDAYKFINGILDEYVKVHKIGGDRKSDSEVEIADKEDSEGI